MEDRLRAYIEELFKEAPSTRKSVELREEMIQNLTEKFCDLCAQGKSPEAAFNVAVAGIGDINELIKGLNKDMNSDENFSEQRRRSAVFTAVAVMLYILSPLPLIIIAMLVPAIEVIGVIVLFAFIAGATGLLIFNGITKPRYIKEDDSIVEDFKEWQSATHEKRALRRSISSALWCVIVIIYFLVSFATGAWYITWVLFIAGAALQSLLSILFSYKA